MFKPKSTHRTDLFDQSKMSFGAHLEELRTTLVKASIWLALGTAIGVYFTADVIKYVSKPFQDELRDRQVKKITATYRSANKSEPSPALMNLMIEYGLVPEQVLVLRCEDDSTLEIEALAKYALSDQLMKRLSSEPITHFEQQIQVRPIDTKLKSFELTESFMIYFKAGLLVGAVISSPAVFWHLWTFLAAGLYPHESRQVYMYLPISLTLFVAGVGLAFFVILRLVVGVLMSTSDSLDVAFEPRLKESMSFVLIIPLAFGVALQLPVVMLALNRFGVVEVAAFTENWRVAVLGVAIVSMVLTPTPDATNMMVMFVPLSLLYFLGIALCRFMPRGYGLGG